MTPGSLSTKLITTQIQHSTATQRDQHLNTSGEPSKPRADLPARPGRRTRGPQLPGQTDTLGPQLSGLKKNTGWGGSEAAPGTHLFQKRQCGRFPPRTRHIYHGTQQAATSPPPSEARHSRGGAGGTCTSTQCQWPGHKSHGGEKPRAHGRPTSGAGRRRLPQRAPKTPALPHGGPHKFTAGNPLKTPGGSR